MNSIEKLIAKRKSQRRAQKGFTLVEIAIVLVIIGLLLGGVLKGQELINSAKIKSDTDTLVALQAASYAYRDRIGSYPGDATAAGATDGQILISNSSATTANSLFADLAAQEFISSDIIKSEYIPEAYFAAGYSAAAAAATGIAIAGKNQVCLFTTADLAKGVDTKLDDGVITTGKVQAITLGTAVGDATTSVCIEL